MSSILSAVEQNRVQVLKLLLGVPVSQRDLDTGLILAIQKNNIECVRILIDAGATVHDLRNSALYIASENGCTEAVKLILDAGCDVNAVVLDKWTALQAAAKRGNEEVLKVLIEGGASINQQDAAGNSPLILTTKDLHGAFSTFQALIDAECDLDRTDSSHRTALHYCARKALGVELLLAAGANPNIQDCDGNTPMHHAATEGFDHVVKHLLNFDANPNIANEYGMFPIHYLAMKNHWEGIDAIATKGGITDIVDKRGKTPIWYAVNHNRPDAVKALLRANCKSDPPCTQSEESSFCPIPLRIALEKELYGIAKLLVLSGCDIHPVYEWVAKMEESKMNEPERPSLFAEDESSDEEDEDLEEALEWFEDWLHQPHSLQQQCRIMIRRIMGFRIREKELAIPLPAALVDYLTLREVDDHHIDGYVM